MTHTLLQQALDALESALSDDQPYIERGKAAITALRAALAQPEPEPVAWYRPSPDGDDSIFRDHRTVVACTGNKWEGFLPLYAAPVCDVPETYFGNMEPVGWLESPNGAFRTNLLYRFNFPSQLLEWKIPLYATPPAAPAPADKVMVPREPTKEFIRLTAIDLYMPQNVVKNLYSAIVAAAAPAPAVPPGMALVSIEELSRLRKHADFNVVELAYEQRESPGPFVGRAGTTNVMFAEQAHGIGGGAQSAVLPPMEDPNCPYIAPEGKVCNKCGHIHRGIGGGGK